MEVPAGNERFGAQVDEDVWGERVKEARVGMEGDR